MRSGEYVKQPGDYQAFIPAPLPPDPVAMDAELTRLLSDADRSLGRFDGIGSVLPNPDLFVAMYVRQEAVLSSQIEESCARRKKVEARTARLIAEEMTLQELRHARKPPQLRIAKVLGISQDGVSRLAKRSDLLLSTLRKSVKAMGDNCRLLLNSKIEILACLHCGSGTIVTPSTEARLDLP